MLFSRLTSRVPETLKKFKVPAIDRSKILKFFYEAYLDIHDEQLAELQKPKLKTKEELK